MIQKWAIACALLVTATLASAETVYLKQSDFLQQTFAGAVPEAKTVWWVGEKKQRVRALTGDDPISLRSRYWRRGEKTAWVLEAIGKELPITAGFVVEGDSITAVEILVYRESRGWEVQLPAFRAQFVGASLAGTSAPTGKVAPLDTTIDGISGATLSVRALTGLSRLALAMHQEVTSGKPGK